MDLIFALFVVFSWLLVSLKRPKQDLVIYKRINLIFNVFRRKNKEQRNLENINTVLIEIAVKQATKRIQPRISCNKIYRKFENKTKQLLADNNLGLHHNWDWKLPLHHWGITPRSLRNYPQITEELPRDHWGITPRSLRNYYPQITEELPPDH
jgi:hypothetical protein